MQVDLVPGSFAGVARKEKKFLFLVTEGLSFGWAKIIASDGPPEWIVCSSSQRETHLRTSCQTSCIRREGKCLESILAALLRSCDFSHTHQTPTWGPTPIKQECWKVCVVHKIEQSKVLVSLLTASKLMKSRLFLLHVACPSDLCCFVIKLVS